MPRWFLALVVFVLPFSVIGAAQTIAPLFIANPVVCFASAGANATVCAQVKITQLVASPGGPQALEGYTLVAHDHGTVALALGTIGNVEIGGAGDVTEVAPLQSGGVFTGPGHVARWSALKLFRPRARTSDPPYTGPVHLDEFSYLRFDNGWSLRGDDVQLYLCSPVGTCRSLGQP
ncbi:MAG: hypothetical protein LAO77_23155 [Acidobacteriia bacterium]|nr:hypothetical protein [Terriglobia bacterium]